MHARTRESVGGGEKDQGKNFTLPDMERGSRDKRKLPTAWEYWARENHLLLTLCKSQTKDVLGLSFKQEQ